MTSNNQPSSGKPSMSKGKLGPALAVTAALGAVVGVMLIVALLVDEDFGGAAETVPENTGTAVEGENPLGATTPTPPAEQATPTTGTPTPSSPSSEATTDDAESPSEIAIPVSAMYLVSAVAKVKGLGSTATFVHEIDACHVLVQNCNTEDVAVLPTIEANCGFINPVKFVLEGDGYTKFEPDGFTAGFRANQFNHVSIGVSGDIVAGGYSLGGEGRGNSEQWPIEGGTVQVDGGTYSIVDDGPDRWSVSVTWGGTSIENYSGDEAAGSVQIICIFDVDE